MSSKATTMQNAATATPEAPEAEKVNPRTERSKQKLDLATGLIKTFLTGKGWVSSNLIHRQFGESGSKEISEGMFGRAKAELGIVHRRVKGENGKPEYQWILPNEVAKANEAEAKAAAEQAAKDAKAATTTP
jgi:hypothetical protein